ncbi:hypothetical protein Tco_0339433 [Tanacetum coccineum]
MECRVRFFNENGLLLEYEVRFTFPKRPYQEELEARILNLIDHQEEQVRQLEEDMRKTKDTFMCLADSLIATPERVKIELNKIKEDYGKRFVTQKELSAEQVFWLKHLNYNPDTSVKSHTPVRIESPSELPKVSLVNESLKKLKYHLASFDKVVKKRTTSDAISTDKNAFEIQIKQLSIDNDQLLKQIMSQEIMHIAMNSVDILNVNKSCVDECNKCLELETELLKKKDFIEKYDNSGENQNAPTFNQLFEINELKAQLQENDTVIRKLNDMIKSLSGKDSVENVKKDINEIERINIELEHNCN